MGQCLPNMLINPESGDGKPKLLLFDRVLCDVPCTGDGTSRKNPEIWETWSRNHGNIFHRMQHAIAKRGCEMLKEGGLLVYSTCSLNPMENESVIAQLLRDFKQLELVDLSDQLPGLKRVPGMSTWKVSDIHGNVIPSLKDVRKRHIKRFLPSMFPPSEEEVERMDLHRAFRVLPHHNNTGGFFVAVLRRRNSASGEGSMRPISEPAPPLEECLGNTELRRAQWLGSKWMRDDFIQLSPRPELKSYLADLRDYYGLSLDFPMHQLFSREKTFATVYFVPGDLGRVVAVEENMALRPTQAGCRIFTKHCCKMAEWSPMGETNRKWRLTQIGLPLVLPYISKQIVRLTLRVFKTLIYEGQLFLKAEDGGQVPIPSNSLARTQIEVTKVGNVVCVLDISSNSKAGCVPVNWQSLTCLRWPHKVELLVNREQLEQLRESLDELFGEYTAPYIE